jgi:hypothetical protein
MERSRREPDHTRFVSARAREVRGSARHGSSDSRVVDDFAFSFSLHDKGACKALVVVAKHYLSAPSGVGCDGALGCHPESFHRLVFFHRLLGVGVRCISRHHPWFFPPRWGGRSDGQMHSQATNLTMARCISRLPTLRWPDALAGYQPYDGQMH